MSAKIKRPAIHHRSPRPKGINRRNFEKVYWPFIPVVVAIGLLLPSALSTGSLANLIKHPGGKVLSYSVSQNPNAMLIDTNAERQAHGDQLLQMNTELSQAATAKAHDMAARDYWSHYTPNGNPPWTFVTAAGYSYQAMGENLATGFGNEQAVINAWMASATHRQNLLNPAYSQVGFGFANSAHYVATGGQPATIFVAFYAEPSGSIPLTGSSNSSSTTESSGSSNSVLGAKTDVVGGFNSKILNPVAPLLLTIIMLVVLVVFITKHTRAVSRYIRKGERFVWQHPIFDASLIVVAVLAIALWQNVGLIK